MARIVTIKPYIHYPFSNDNPCKMSLKVTIDSKHVFVVKDILTVNPRFWGVTTNRFNRKTSHSMKELDQLNEILDSLDDRINKFVNRKLREKMPYIERIDSIENGLRAEVEKHFTPTAYNLAWEVCDKTCVGFTTPRSEFYKNLESVIIKPKINKNLKIREYALFSVNGKDFFKSILLHIEENSSTPFIAVDPETLKIYESKGNYSINAYPYAKKIEPEIKSPVLEIAELKSKVEDLEDLVYLLEEKINKLDMYIANIIREKSQNK